MDLKLEIPGQDWLELSIEIVEGSIESASLKGSGCADFLLALDQMRSELKGPVSELKIPEGDDHVGMMMRELVLRLQGVWQFPYKDEELCHCRMVPVKVVDAAIITGADTIDDICRRTNAGTGCGTCRPNSQEIIQYRKFKKSS